MSSIAVQGNASGAGVITLTSPNTSSSYTSTLPAATTTLVGTDATQTLTNKTIGSGYAGSVVISSTAVASTSGTSIDFTGIPSWVKRVTVLFNGVSTNGTSTPILRIGSGSFLTSGYASNSMQIVNAATPNGGVLASGFYLWPTWGSSVDMFGAVTLFNITGNTWILSGTTGANSTIQGTIINGGIALGGVLDRVRITTLNGTDVFDAGSINILYEG